MPRPDPLLKAMVATANDSDGTGFGISITLTVGGGVITGRLMNRVDWWAALVGSTADERAQEFLAEVGAGYQRAITEAGTARTEFAHVGFARLATPGVGLLPQQDRDGVFWRIRLSEVTAWSFGSVS